MNKNAGLIVFYRNKNDVSLIKFAVSFTFCHIYMLKSELRGIMICSSCSSPLLYLAMAIRASEKAMDGVKCDTVSFFISYTNSVINLSLWAVCCVS